MVCRKKVQTLGWGGVILNLEHWGPAQAKVPQGWLSGGGIDPTHGVRMESSVIYPIPTRTCTARCELFSELRVRGARQKCIQT